MSDRPVLDPVPKTKPHDYSYRAIKAQMAKPGVVTVPTHPGEWHNPNQKYLAHRGQDNGGTCTGQAGAYGARHNYIKLTGDAPTPEELTQIKRNVIDSLGSRVDILPAKEFSSECAYQMGRYFGNITYPSGGDIRFVARAIRDYGICLESQWHSDKERLKVWTYPPGARQTPDGGVTPEEAAEFSAKHRIKGWAMVGRADGFATYDEICAAIYEKGWVMCAIPIYTNFMEMQGQEVPVYPFPNGEIDGYHAQIVDGYSPDALDIEHSWFGWCGQHGKLPKEYINYAIDQCVWLVWLDEEETLIGQEIYEKFEVTSNVPAWVRVNGNPIGTTPIKFAIEHDKIYEVAVGADGYVTQTEPVDDSMKLDDGSVGHNFVLDPVIPTPQPVKSWFEIFVDFLKSLIALFKR